MGQGMRLFCRAADRQGCRRRQNQPEEKKSDDTQVNTNTFDDHIFWQRTAGQASGGRRTKEKWEHILAYTSQNKTGMQSRAGTQTNDQQEELDEIYRSKYDYRKFLKQFCRLREEVELDTESFDYIFLQLWNGTLWKYSIDRTVGV